MMNRRRGWRLALLLGGLAPAALPVRHFVFLRESSNINVCIAFEAYEGDAR